MDWKVFVSFFESLVFSDVVEVVSSDNDSSFHFAANDDSSQDSSTNTYVTGEWAFLVNIGSFNGRFGGFET